MPNIYRKLADMNVEEIQNIIRSTVKESMAAYKTKEENSTSNLITMKEVAALYKVSLVTIHKWRKHKILPPTIKKGGRVFFRRDEILKSLEK